MKRLLLPLACALVWAAASPAPASAHWWNFHSKKHADASAAPKQHKTKRSWFHHEHHARNSSDPLYTSGPKSVGWWHKMPGPAGAGS